MEITLNVNVSAPELATAITVLASALGGSTTAIIPKEQPTEKPRTFKVDKENKKSEVTEDKPQEQSNQPDKTDSEEKQISLEEVRGKLAELTRAGKPVKELINKFGASKLSEIPPEKYAEVLKEAGGL